MSESFYDVLEVEADATTEEIERAYRAKVKETHPDVSDDPDAEERFKRVQQAKDVLTDEAERGRYDRLGHDRYLERDRGPFEHDTSGDATERDTTDRDETARDGTAGTGSGTGSSGRSRRRQRSTRRSDPFGWDTSSEQSTASDTAADEAAGGATAGEATENGGTGQFGDGGTGERGWDQSRSGPSDQHGESGGSSYATRTAYREQSFDTVRVPLTPRSIIQITSMFVLYPVFVAAAIFPAFPATVNVVVGLCTLFIIAYLMSIPEVAIVVFGGWSVLTPLLLAALEPLSLFSLVGIIALVAAWFPFGLAFLTRAALRS